MNVALIGYGYWGSIAARAIARVATLKWILETDPANRHQAALDWEPWGTRIGDDLGIASGAEAVWVATPTADHETRVRQALDLGLHVLCEKPFVFQPDTAIDLCNQAKEAKLALMVGHLTLHTGRQEAFTELWRRPGGVSRVVAIRRNEEASLSDGSVLFGIGPHEVSPLVNVMGGPTDVTCWGTEHRVECELRFNGKHEAVIELDWLAEERYRAFTCDDTLVNMPDVMEPLLREAEVFKSVVEGNDREKWRWDAFQTTSALWELERCRTSP